ncbi:MAG: tRNA (adenosine(37)-N6)-dimethylallyltransferase MiaA [Candidatus Doudnabacteria bacterium]|jgi:tRNA dimethylallyltransferase
MIHNSRILILVGPTSSGKSELAVQLAKKFHGEIISADSRQIYKGMDLGTGKVPGKWNLSNKSYPTYIYKSIPHHLIDFQNPARQYSASRFQTVARKKIAQIIKRGVVPIICGGTAHWIDAVIYNQTLPEVKPNTKLRAKLEKQSAEALFKRLIRLDPVRASNIDKFNKRRLIRALEIVISTGRPVAPLGAVLSSPDASGEPKGRYPTLWLGVNLPQKDLYQKIDARLKQRFKAGMINEVTQLHKSGLSFKRLESFGLEYKFISLFLQKKISREELVIQLSFAIKHYSKRQMTWWKRNQEIIWIKPEIKKAIKLTKKFLKS